MRFFFVSAVLGTLAVPALTLPSSSHVIHEKRDAIQRKWVQTELDPYHVYPARIGLKQSNLDLGAQYLSEISDPMSSRYGKHYTAEEVIDLFAPSEDSVEVVKSWLIDSGIRAERISHSANKAWLQFDASLAEMESLLQTKYYHYEPVSGGRKHIGCEDYKLPAAVSDHVDYVLPGVKLLPTRAMGDIKKRGLPARSRRSLSKRETIDPQYTDEILANINNTAYCDLYIYPACIRALYNIPLGKLAHPGNEMGIYEYGDVYDQKDLDLFYQQYQPNIPAGTAPTLASVAGAPAPTDVWDAGLESVLDFQIAYPIIYPQSTTLFQVNDSQEIANQKKAPGLFNTFLDAIDGSYCTYTYDNETGDDPTVDPIYPASQHQCGVYKPTNVISVSYGAADADFPYYYQIRQCNEYMKLGLQGVTLLFASGDYGIEDAQDYCLGSGHNIFAPSFPNCPYITMVGATTIAPGGKVTDPEIATHRIQSGGGFSNVYPIPSYQQSAVSTYFNNHDPGYPYYSSLNGSIGANGGIYNRIGRGYPDVAALGDHAALVYGESNYTTGGTSMSTPLIGAIITRINEERLAVGKKTVGFLNPTLYANPQMFNDITIGNQSGAGCSTAIGFSCVPGWDPVTGLGTPKYASWLKVFLALP